MFCVGISPREGKLFHFAAQQASRPKVFSREVEALPWCAEKTDNPSRCYCHEMEIAENDNAATQATTRVVDILLGGAVAVGLVLRIVQYVSRGSLWLDEAMLAISIVSRPARALIFSPLEFNQTAPPLFLQLAKLSTRIFGPSDMALRLPAFLCSIAGLVLFALVARRMLDGIAAVVTVTFFSIAAYLVQYSAELKPYSSDAFAAVLLIYVGMRLHASAFSRKWLAISAVTVCSVVWLSDTSLIVVGGVGLALLYLAVHENDRRALTMAARLAPLWIAVAIGAALGTKRRLAVFTGHMLHFLWSNAFVPAPTSWRNAAFVPKVTLRFFNEALGIRTFASLCLVVVVVGMWSLWKRPNRETFALALGPVLVALIASAAKMYPYSGGRVSLFLAPSFLILFGAGIGRIGSFLPRGSVPIQVALFFFFANPPEFITHVTPPPWLREQIEPVLSTVSANRQPGDKIYVFWAAIPATIYYGPRHNIIRNSWVAGKLNGDDWHNYKGDFDQFRGAPRVWVIFSHSKIPGQREGIMSYLDSLGVRQPGSGYPATYPPDQDASVALYDFSKAATISGGQ
jgi:hypothetical protein